MNERNAMEPVRLGIVGCGVIGRIHARVATESRFIEPIAVVDIRESVAQEVASTHTIPKAYTSIEQLVADPDIEAVVVALPTGGRLPVALKALSAGKHTLVEKPIGMNRAEVEALINAQNDLIAGCCSARMRCLPSAQVASDFIASGALGQLRVIRCRALKGAGAPPKNPPPVWRLNRALNGGGILVNWGSYDLDYLLGLTGWSLQPRHVLAQTWQVANVFQQYAAPGSDAETHITALVTCANGCVLSYERSEFAAIANDEAWQIIGDRGTLRMQMTPGSGKRILFDEATAEGVATRVIWEGDEQPGLEHKLVLEDFAQAVREQRPPRTSFQQALQVQQLVDAIYASADQGQPISFG
jgi:UDP-N-acetyl-2-amino-2-deoxyglucuronate dehydrogenase